MVTRNFLIALCILATFLSVSIADGMRLSSASFDKQRFDVSAKTFGNKTVNLMELQLFADKHNVEWF